MTLASAPLAQKLWTVLNPPSAKTGAPDPVPSDKIKNYAAGYVKMLQAGIVINAVPSSVSASAAPPGSSIAGGQSSGGLITALLGPVMAAEAGKGLTPLALPGLLLECTAIAAYIMASAKVSFAAGMITGKSTATTSSPGPLAAGTGNNGKITGLVGSALASKIKSATTFTGPKQIAFYTALCDFTMASGAVKFPAATVQGTCTSAGKMTLGVAAGGTIA